MILSFGIENKSRPAETVPIAAAAQIRREKIKN